jgi:hypothetical protein
VPAAIPAQGGRLDDPLPAAITIAD